MNIAIESYVLNHHQRSGLMTYGEGLITSLSRLKDVNHHYYLLYYSLLRSSREMPGPEDVNLTKNVLRVPDRLFWGRESIVDNIILPSYFKKNKIEVFHRIHGYDIPDVKNVYRILTVHDLRTLTIGDPIWQQNIAHYKRALNSLDMCVVVSESTKRDIIEHFKISEQKIKVIHLGADSRFSPATAQTIENVRAQFNLSEPYLFAVGSVPRKNIAGIIQAFAASGCQHQFKLVLACHQDVLKYLALADSLGIKDRVVFLPKASDSDIIALYSGCQAFVFPSLYEGFGLPILEAMQCGAPVITANNSSCPEVIGNAGITVDPHNVNAIADAIKVMCHDNAFRNACIQRGFEQSKLFSWDTYAQEIRKVYERS